MTIARILCWAGFHRWGKSYHYNGIVESLCVRCYRAIKRRPLRA